MCIGEEVVPKEKGKDFGSYSTMSRSKAELLNKNASLPGIYTQQIQYVHMCSIYTSYTIQFMQYIHIIIIVFTTYHTMYIILNIYYMYAYTHYTLHNVYTIPYILHTIYYSLHYIGGDLPGFLPLREDFDIEYDNDAEALLADLEFYDDEHPSEKELKHSVISIFNKKLDEREYRKRFAIDRGLVDFKRHQLVSMPLFLYMIYCHIYTSTVIYICVHLLSYIL